MMKPKRRIILLKLIRAISYAINQHISVKRNFSLVDREEKEFVEGDDN